MRIRRLATLTVGAAVGAGAMYLFDPEHGEERRRAARKRALAQARTGAARAIVDMRGRAQELAVAAMDGYRSGQDVEVVDDERLAPR